MSDGLLMDLTANRARGLVLVHSSDVHRENRVRADFDFDPVLPAIISTRADEGVDHRVEPGDDENERKGCAPQAATQAATRAGRWPRNGVAFS
jgi:hypothetical protein